MRKYDIIIYGAYGYTGELIALEFINKNYKILLAGRNEDKLKALSLKTGFDYSTGDLNNKTQINELFSQAYLVINAAGPFINTCVQVVEACIESKTHYIDINGDIKVFELIKTYNQKALNTGIMLLPGTGFDVVPSDCLAVKLKKLMPDAINLNIAFATIGGGVSHGTALTVAGRLGEYALKRENGKLKPVLMGKHSMWVDFGIMKKFVMSISWGDVSTAHFSTGIENIETFMAVKPKVYNLLKFQIAVNWLLRTKVVKNILRKNIDKNISGPNEESRKKGFSLFWAETQNNEGKTHTLKLKTLEGYTLTAKASVLIAKKITDNSFKPGYQTPASTYGENLIFEIEGTEEL